MGWGGGGGRITKRERGVGNEGGWEERGNSNSKTLCYKECTLGSVKNLTTSPC